MYIGIKGAGKEPEEQRRKEDRKNPEQRTKSKATFRLTGTHLALEEIRSRVVTGLVDSSVHFTSKVNSTAQSGQKSWQVQS